MNDPGWRPRVTHSARDLVSAQREMGLRGMACVGCPVWGKAKSHLDCTEDFVWREETPFPFHLTVQSYAW